MKTNPYTSLRSQGDGQPESGSPSEFSLAAKITLCVIGLLLFAANPWRDLWFYEDIAAHEGFETTADAYIIGFAVQLIATIAFFPVAIYLIVYGIGRSKRFSVLPRFDRFTWGWGIFASILALLMVLNESDYFFYAIGHSHHFDTLAISLGFLAFIYIWWCCSIAHGAAARPAKRLAIRRRR